MIIIFFQTGDNCLVQLASRYTQELQRLVGSLAYTTPSTLINCAEVLQQLEDLRLAEWSDHAPPPPSAPLPGRYNNTWQSILNVLNVLLLSQYYKLYYFTQYRKYCRDQKKSFNGNQQRHESKSLSFLLWKPVT